MLSGSVAPMPDGIWVWEEVATVAAPGMEESVENGDAEAWVASSLSAVLVVEKEWLPIVPRMI